MKMKDKETAVRLLREREEGVPHTFDEIGRLTGYERKQLGRLAKDLRDGSDDVAILAHGNAGRQPTTTATEAEYAYLRKLKEPYPSITIAHFRDIFIEDVIRNPDRKGDVASYGLVPRSKSWFRQLFIREGWESPAGRPVGSRDGRGAHPLRDPSPRRGELVQVDGTEDDWLGDGNRWTLHIAVDDATTEVLSGWFMPSECTRGCCRMSKLMLERRGKPRALYSDRHSIFLSTKNGAPTQFGAMMSDLGIRMIFANSCEAKGRVERYNQTTQLRLPNDVIRFGIGSYGELNDWFNGFYVGYLNSKFAFRPADPNDAFTPMPDDFDYASVFRGRYTRVVREGMISYETHLYRLVDRNGEMGTIRDGTTVNLYRDAFTEELYVERYGKRYACIDVGSRKREPMDEAENQKEVEQLLRSYRRQ